MNNRVIVIAKNTFREAVRDKIFYGLFGFAIFFILLDLFFAGVAAGDMVMIRSFGLAGIYIFGLIITIFLGASIMHKEIDRRTLYFVLSKPVSRRDVILGKFLGLFSAVSLTTIFMAVVYLGVVFYEGGLFDSLALLAVFFQILELGFFVALLVFFSSVASPMLATISSIIILFVGHMFDAMVENAEIIGAGVYNFVITLSYVLPNLGKFNIRNLVVHDITISWLSVVSVVAYALFYGGLLLYLGYQLFKNREL